MGLQSVVKGIVSRMEKIDTMNMNALDKWRKRVVSIAKDLSQSDDTSRQESFETAVTNVARDFIGASLEHPDTFLYRLEPEVQAHRKRALIEGDAILDSFQPPSPGRPQVMQTASLEDEELLKENLEGLNGLNNVSLIEIKHRIPASNASNYKKNKQHQTQVVSKAQTAHAKLVQKLYVRSPVTNLESHLEPIAKVHTQEPSIVVGICDMREDSEIQQYLISFDDTFSDLVEIILESDNAASLPDFWCKQNDRLKNQVTESATWWECQTASTRVVDAIMDRKGGENRSTKNEPREKKKVEIRSVLSHGEYLVALVAKGGAESGVPVDIPRSHRQAASIHFQEKVFPNDKVDRLLLMETGLDASSMIFDKRLFDHQSNPLFVELQAANHDAGKGKGRMS